MQDLQIKMRESIRLALQEFSEIAKEEEDGDYTDAMLSMDRTRAEGFAEGLQLAYRIFFDTDYNPPIIEEEE